ncbi:DUF2953 domain-containing protein [Bacillus niameyensis]|uniref:DUF2953 domain-containing protein n=1 Tax=Bacillus niameyensis TaxID=1522308 RepID=UPI000783D0A4|nr:DUF2953 domain-containing protein [Bacillus niameyensis]
MLIMIICGIAILFLFLIFIMMNINIQILIMTGVEENKATIEITSFFGLFRFKKDFSDLYHIVEEEMEEEPDSTSVNIKALMSDLKFFYHFFLDFIQKLKVKKMEWETSIGLGDAADTAVLAGAIWSIKGIILSWMKSYLTFNPRVHVFPHYQQIWFQTRIQCMVDLKAGHAIWTGYKFYRQWKRYKRLSHYSEKNRRVING